jgi:hypothetical protein
LWDVGGRKEEKGKRRGKEDIPALASAGLGPQTTTQQQQQDYESQRDCAEDRDELAGGWGVATV